MMKKLKSWMNSRRYNSHWMRLVVGGYVVYLGGKILVNQYQAGELSIPLTLCAILLIVLAVPVALISLYAVVNGYSVEYKGKIGPSTQQQEDRKEPDTPED